MDYLKVNEKMERIFGKKLDALFRLLNKRPSAVLTRKNGDIKMIKRMTNLAPYRGGVKFFKS